VPAKVNLQLSVGPRESDGFHNLVSVFQAISIFDEITLTLAEPGHGLVISMSGDHTHGVPVDANNLAAQAALPTASNGNTPGRVVITGVGAITPLGLTVDETWSQLIAGHSGIDYITRFDTSDLRVNFAGEVRGFDPGQYMDRKEARRLRLLLELALERGHECHERVGHDARRLERR
jgi:hypothetical protein